MRPRLIVIALTLLLGGCANGMHISGTDDSESDRQADAFSTYLSARFAAGEHDMPQAARYYSLTLRKDPTSASLLVLSFFYATTSGNIDAAGKYANDVVAQTPDDRAARLALAVVAFKRKDYAEVRKQLSLSAKGPFTVLTISLFDGWAAAASGDAAGAAADMKALTAQSGAQGVGAFHAALIEDFLGKTEEADKGYQKALASNPNSPRVIEAYGNFLERSGRAADATAFYNLSLRNAALVPVVQTGLARIAANKKPAPMIATAEDGAAEGLFGVAASLTDQASADVSILYLRMTLYLRPDLALAQVLLADRFETLHKYDEAVAIYRQIGKSSPYYRMAAVEAAIDEARMDKNSNSIRDLKLLADADVNDSETWIALGDSYRGAEKFDAAIAAYDHAEKAIGTPAKRDWPLFYARAMAEEKDHAWEKAEADINIALKLSPDEPELLNYLGYSWVDQGRRIPEALAMLEKARSLRPYDGYIVDSVGWAYFRLGRYDDAARTLEAAVLLVPGDPTINDHFGDALWKAGHKMEARFQWNHALAFTTEDADKPLIERKLKTGLTG